MTDPPTHEPLVPAYRPRKYLSVSTLISFARCPRRYFYQKCGLQSYGIALAPTYGQAMHKAIPVALTTGDSAAAFAAFMEIWEPVEAQRKEEGYAEDDRRNPRTAMRSISHFIHTHKDDKSLYRLVAPPEGSLIPDEQTSDYEIAWVLDINLPVPLVGRFDGLCQHRDTEEKYIWEFKTTSRLGGSFFEAHEMNIQNFAYTLAGQTATGWDIRGLMVEGMLVSKTKVDNLCQPIPAQPHHLRDIITWLYRVGHDLLSVEQYAHQLMSEGRDPCDAFTKHFEACTPYAFFYMSGFRCEYADLCNVPSWRHLTDLYTVADEHDFLSSLPDEAVPVPTVKD